MLMDALADGGVPTEDVAYLETHGTGTAIGDPMEVFMLCSTPKTECT